MIKPAGTNSSSRLALALSLNNKQVDGPGVFGAGTVGPPHSP